MYLRVISEMYMGGKLNAKDLLCDRRITENKPQGSPVVKANLRG